MRVLREFLKIRGIYESICIFIFAAVNKNILRICRNFEEFAREKEDKSFHSSCIFNSTEVFKNSM